MKETFTRTVTRERKDDSVSAGVPEPKDFRQLIASMPATLKETRDGKAWLRYAGYADGSDSQGLLIFASDFHLHMLNRATVWISDGTFGMPPGIFHQFYVIHGMESIDGKAYPCVYALLSDKHTNSYRKLFEVVKTMCNKGPEVVIVDLETAPINMYRHHWPKVIIEACEFHVKKAMKEQMGKKGCLVTYNNNTKVQYAITMFKMLMYMPAEEIVELYETIVEPLFRKLSMPDTDFVDDPDDPDMDDVDVFFNNKHDNTKLPIEIVKYTEYLEKTYIGEINPRTGRRRCPTFPHHVWSKYNALLAGRFRTSNSAEQWHSAIQASLAKLGSHWRFINWLSQEEMLKKEEHRRQICRINPDIPETMDDMSKRKALSKANYQKLQNLVKAFGVMPHLELLESLADIFKKNKKRLSA